MHSPRPDHSPGPDAARAFAPPLWAWLLTAAGLALFLTLGVWQLQRGALKERLRDSLLDAASTPVILDRNTPAPEPLAVRRAEARGRYVAERTLLLDGQTHDSRPGYHAWTPLALADGAVVLVNRGWVPDAAHATAPPAGEHAVRGYFRALPEPGLRLSGVDNCPAAPAFPAVVLYPTAAELACLLERPVLAGVLLLEPSDPHGFVREWVGAGFAPERHYGYAVQWFALALTTVVLFVVMSRRRT